MFLYDGLISIPFPLDCHCGSPKNDIDGLFNVPLWSREGWLTGCLRRSHQLHRLPQELYVQERVLCDFFPFAFFYFGFYFILFCLFVPCMVHLLIVLSLPVLSSSPGHPSCLGLRPELALRVDEPWQCFNCKMCQKCNLDTSDVSLQDHHRPSWQLSIKVWRRLIICSA